MNKRDRRVQERRREWNQSWTRTWRPWAETYPQLESLTQPEDVFLESDARPVRWNPHDRLTTKLEYRTSMRNLGDSSSAGTSFLSDFV
jgi:hypothetical protein